MISLLFALLISVWVTAIAILSVQNATAITIKFLFFQSIQMPLGVVLAFCLSIGLMATVLIKPLWRLTGSGSAPDDNQDWS